MRSIGYRSEEFPRCPQCGSNAKGVVPKYGPRGPDGPQRYECVRCKRYYTERTGDPLARFRAPRGDILSAADRVIRGRKSVASTAHLFEVSWATVRNWVRVVEDSPPLRKEAQELVDGWNLDIERLHDLAKRAQVVGLLGDEEYMTFRRQLNSDGGVDDELLIRIGHAANVVQVLEDLAYDARAKPKK